MIVEVRTYKLKPGQRDGFIEGAKLWLVHGRSVSSYARGA
jgi:hypothetical protein